VEEHQLEGQFRVAPPGPVGLEADIAILVVRQFAQFLRQRDVGFFVRRRRELFCAKRDVVESEPRACSRKQECDEREANQAQRRDATSS
jgi:hypothetical protein